MTEPMILILHNDVATGRHLAAALQPLAGAVRVVTALDELVRDLRRYDPEVTLLPLRSPGRRELLTVLVGDLAPVTRQVLLVSGDEIERTVGIKGVFEQLVMDPLPTPAMVRGVTQRALAAATPPATVLVVEDSFVNLDLVADLLHARSYRVLRATNAEDGLEIARQIRPDACLMDIYLPGMSGIDAVRAIKACPETESVPIVMFSANGTEEAIGEALDAGAIDFIVKPFSPRVLLEKLSLVLAKRSLLAHA